MRVLLIACHPREDSFSAALRARVQAALEARGHVVELRDLYAEGFRPQVEAEEHRSIHTPGVNERGIEDHVRALRAAEALVLVYPTWWYGMPAMLKGWFDRVWLAGIAFTLGEGAIQPALTNIKRIAAVTTYGSPLWLLWAMGWPDYKLMSRGLRRLCAKGCTLDWLYLTRMDQRRREECADFAETVAARFARW